MRSVRARWIVGAFLAVGLFAGPQLAAAQARVDDGSPRARTYGTSPIGHTISAPSFVPRVFLPEGAVPSSMELAACDEDPAGEVQAQFIELEGQDGPFVVLAQAATGDAAEPGCTRFSVPLMPTTTVDNIGHNYLVVVNITGITDKTRLQAVRIFYGLQSSPAPATATFADVPTSHPYFAFVEALWAAGITTGCNASPLLFCPDAPLTRGQAAVLFGRALGLHFAP